MILGQREGLPAQYSVLEVFTECVLLLTLYIQQLRCGVNLHALFPSSAAFMIPWGEGSFGHCVRCKNCCPLTSDGRELWEGVETGQGGEKAGTA